MHWVSIENFKAIKKIDKLNIDDMVCILGEQATGKSTIAKIVYFCRDIRNEFINLLNDISSFDTWRDFNKAFHRDVLKQKFINIFGYTNKISYFTIEYHFSEQNFIVISNTKDENKYADFGFGNMENQLKEIFSEWREKKKSAFTIDINKGITEPQDWENIKKGLKRKIENEIFFDDYSLYYIPAGRGLLSRKVFGQMLSQSTLSERQTNRRLDREYTFGIVDALTRQYCLTVEKIRETWEQSIGSLLISAKPDTNLEDALTMNNLAETVLKGYYTTYKGNDYITIDNNQNIPIGFASSGQQEVLWIINILIYITLVEGKSFVVIEEPEAHLYPSAQQILMQVLAAFVNKTGAELFITTHSPYTILAINNLLFAGDIDKTCDDKQDLSTIVPDVAWLSIEKVFGYSLSDGYLKNIKVDDITMLSIVELDKAASDMTDEFDRMLQIKLGRKRQ